MFKFYEIQLLIVLVPGLSISMPVAGYVPDVYQDEYVTVRAAVMESEYKPVHFGDALTLIVEVEFKNNEVLIESLGEDFFRKNWSAEKGISLFGLPLLTSEKKPENYTKLRASYKFQILDCPKKLISCIGHKEYDIPVFSLGYQLIDGTGDVQNNKSVRFRPWPGKVVITQALPIRTQTLDEFSTYFPGGAYPPALPVDDTVSGTLWMLLTGGILLLAGFLPRLFHISDVPYLVEVNRKSGRRWEQVLVRLQNDSEDLPNEVWTDYLRRCVTWYALDEIGVNPYASLNGDYASVENSGLDKEFRTFFLDVVNQENIEQDQRNDYINRFMKLAGINISVRSGETIA